MEVEVEVREANCLAKSKHFSLPHLALEASGKRSHISPDVTLPPPAHSLEGTGAQSTDRCWHHSRRMRESMSTPRISVHRDKEVFGSSLGAVVLGDVY